METEDFKETHKEIFENCPNKGARWSLESYYRHQKTRQRAATLQRIKQTGRTPKNSTIAKYKLTDAEMRECIDHFNSKN